MPSQDRGSKGPTVEVHLVEVFRASPESLENAIAELLKQLAQTNSKLVWIYTGSSQ